MKTLTINGISTTKELGQENYTTFYPSHRPMEMFYQYDYRHTDGELFSCIGRTLGICREKRNKWLQNK